MTSIIRTERLTKTYGAHRGINDVDLEVAENEIFGFLGPNGAGKTTTIRTAARPDPADLGPRVRVRHRDHRRPGRHPPADRLHPGRVRARTTASPAARRSSTSRTSAAAWTPRTRPTSWSGWTSTRAASSRSYSKGNKQKIGLVIALQHRPDLLILDEPTSGLDPLVQQTFYELVREARDGGPLGLPVQPHPVRGRAHLRPRRDHPRRPAGQGRPDRGAAGPRPPPGGAALRRHGPGRRVHARCAGVSRCERRGPHAAAARARGRSRRSSRPRRSTSCSTSSAASPASRRRSSPSTAHGADGAGEVEPQAVAS